MIMIVPDRLKTSISANTAGIILTVQQNPLMDPLRWLNILPEACLPIAALSNLA